MNADECVLEIISRIRSECSGCTQAELRVQPGIKDIEKIRIFINTVKNARLLDEQKKHLASKNGYFGKYGGMFLPELLISPMKALAESFKELDSME